jgi:hypothetical protein
MSVEVASRFSNTIIRFRYKHVRQDSNQCAIDGFSIEAMLYGIDIVNFNYIILG